MPPSTCSEKQAAWSAMPASLMGAAHWATAAPTRTQVESTPTTGEKGSIFLTVLGNLAFASMPTMMGTRTTWTVEMATPTASTGTMAPRMSLQRRGVMKMAPTVVTVVISTDRATSPLAMYVHRLDACPPLMEPTRTMPAVRAGLRPKTLARPRAMAGMRP